MSYVYSQDTQAIMLLGVDFTKSQDREILAGGPMNAIALKLQLGKFRFGDLLDKDTQPAALNCIKDVCDVEQVKKLLDGGFALALAQEQFSTRAIGAVSLFDEGYPDRLKQKMGNAAPLVLFYCGDLELASQPSIGVVGPRDVSSEMEEYAWKTGMVIESEGYVLVSGNAEGVDKEAMRGALEGDTGKAMAVVSGNLIETAMNREHTKYHGRELLLAPFSPYTGFTASNAMGRNKADLRVE